MPFKVLLFPALPAAQIWWLIAVRTFFEGQEMSHIIHLQVRVLPIWSLNVRGPKGPKRSSKFVEQAGWTPSFDGARGEQHHTHVHHLYV